MTLPASTKFNCCVTPKLDHVSFDFDPDMIAIISSAGDETCLDREQVESLRDQLTQWLEVAK